MEVEQEDNLQLISLKTIRPLSNRPRDRALITKRASLNLSGLVHLANKQRSSKTRTVLKTARPCEANGNALLPQVVNSQVTLLTLKIAPQLLTNQVTEMIR